MPKNLPHHDWEGDHNTEARLKFGALAFASEVHFNLVEVLHNLVGWEVVEVVENWLDPIAWD